MWAEARHQGHDLIGRRFVIKDERGRVLLELPFAEVLGAAPRWSASPVRALQQYATALVFNHKATAYQVMALVPSFGPHVDR